MSSPIPIGNPPITQAWLGIWYVPLRDEPDPLQIEIVKRLDLKPWKTIPATSFIDPYDMAETLVRARDASSDPPQLTYLFIPGTRFDVHGTRRGRGGGWYDRFLSRIPRSWLRIGVCRSDQWSETDLERRAWDEPMDHIVRL